jgi:hypothetical protein
MDTKAAEYARTPKASPNSEMLAELAKRLECARIPPLFPFSPLDT